MGIRQFKPVTSATRFRSVSDFADVTKTTPEKSLLEPLKRTGGRNNKGHITTRWQGGGHKRRYRRIDFRRDKFGVPARVASVEYDPNRTARIALLHYADGEKRYIVAPKGLAVATPSSRAPAPTSASATPCRCSRSRSAPRCTTWSSRSAAAVSCAARPAPASRWWRRKAIT